MSAIAALFEELVAAIRAANPGRPALIGVGGAQGSGKSTVCAAFAASHPRVAHFSLDDVYKTQAERALRADIYSSERIAIEPRYFYPGRNRDDITSGLAQARPLFLTRGPPGTHDLGLAKGLIARLGRDTESFLPRFDKLADDRANAASWPEFHGPADVILIDGWCFGATAPPDGRPINALEEDDVFGAWQEATSAALNSDYAQFFSSFDEIVYLQAPSFEIVHRWRGEQQEAMLGRPMTVEERAELDRFIQHYERLTRHMLAGGHSAGWIVRLDEARNVLGIEQR